MNPGDGTAKGVAIRRADSGDADDAAGVMLRARHANFPAIPAPIHSDDEVRSWFAGSLMDSSDVWVADRAGEIVGVLVLRGVWLDQLYIDPEYTDQGIGARFVATAKAEADQRLELWTFQSNQGARRFYQRHGFVEMESTDGDNEEGEPDVRYRWDRH